MRILVFTTFYVPLSGGAEIALHELMRHLPDIDFDVITVRGRGHLPRFEATDNVTLYRLGLGIPTDKYVFPCTAYRLGVQLVRSDDYAAILSIMASYAGLAAARLHERFPCIPMILNLQEGRDFSQFRAFVKNRLFRRIVARADRITAISRHLVNIAQQFGARSEIVETIPNGVDLARFGAPHSRNTLESIRKKIGVAHNEYLLISTSRFEEKNGLEHIIRALPYILERHSVKLLLLGNGSLTSRLQQIARSLNLASRVILHSPLSHARLVSYLAAADVFVRPSLSEGFGNSFIEAMAAGVPVVATQVGGIADFLRPGENGIVCEPNNARSVASAILYILDKPILRHRLIAAGRVTAAEYGWENIAAAYRGVFSRCTHPPSSSICSSLGI